MDLKIDDIVKQVLFEVNMHKETEKTAEKGVMAAEKENSKTAVLISPEEYELKEYKIPKIKAKEILVRVEGCCVTPLDAMEFMKEKRNGQGNPMGQQGTGVIVKLGSPGLQDANGKALAIGDSVICAKKAGNTVGAYSGKRIESAVNLNSWFSEYVILQENTQIYKVNQLDLESRLLIEPVMAVNRAVQRIVKLCQLDSTKKVVILGCGLEGLLSISILNCMGIHQITAVDGDENLLKLAKLLGAMEVIDFHDTKGTPGMIDAVKKCFGNNLADAMFQCTDSSLARNIAKRFVKNVRNVAELGFVLGKVKTETRYFEDSLPASGRCYLPREYELALSILEKAAKLELPLYRLLTHRFLLEQINEAHWTVLGEEGLTIAIFNR